MRVVSELLITQYHHVWVVNERIEEVCCLDQRQSAMTKWSDARIHSNSYKPKTFPLPDQHSKTMQDMTNWLPRGCTQCLAVFQIQNVEFVNVLEQKVQESLTTATTINHCNCTLYQMPVLCIQWHIVISIQQTFPNQPT